MLVSPHQSAPWDSARWPHFHQAELACRCSRFCGGEYWHDPDFLDALERLRALVGKPLVINSGHRCAQWNAAVGGAPLSMHKSIAA
ncbi:MAG: D-Ala-D-Ala carboxypeptidase family metallohydrolase, partial [Pseudomonadota bacterium]